MEIKIRELSTQDMKHVTGGLAFGWYDADAVNPLQFVNTTPQGPDYLINVTNVPGLLF